jgi:5-methylcytosine-specific restriction enzyme A
LLVIPGEQNLEPDKEGTCQLCGRRVGEGHLTRHHLLPRSLARRMRRRKMARRELKRRDPAQTIALCRPCHRNVHAFLSNADLSRGHDSLETLSVHPDVRRFTEWVRGKPHGRL